MTAVLARRTGLVAGLIGLVGLTVHHRAAAGTPGEGDLALYRETIAYLRDGVPYYDAVRAGLLDGGYGLGSVFNWRTPLHPWLVAIAGSDAVAQLALGIIALGATAGLVLLTLRTEGFGAALLGGVVAGLAACAALVPGSVHFAEVTAGFLILASVVTHGLGRRTAAAGLGLAALLVRELAGLYVAVALVLAVRRRDWREAALWAGGCALYTVYFAVHGLQVAAHQRPTDPTYDEGWLQFGGPRFALETAHFNGILLALPLAVTAVLLAVALTGFAAEPRSSAMQLAGLTLAGYVLVFMVVGKDVNTYWGAVYTPLLALGVAAAPRALRRDGRTELE